MIILLHFILFMIWGPYPIILRIYSWLCAQGPFLEGLRKPYKVRELESFKAYKSSTPSTHSLYYHFRFRDDCFKVLLSQNYTPPACTFFSSEHGHNF